MNPPTAAILKPRPIDIRAISKTLNMSQKQIAAVVGATPRTISRWLRGDQTKARPESSLELRKLARLQWLLQHLLPEEEIGAWMSASNEAFQGRAPIDMLERGEIDQVIGALEMVAEGGFY